MQAPVFGFGQIAQIPKDTPPPLFVHCDKMKKNKIFFQKPLDS